MGADADTSEAGTTNPCIQNPLGAILDMLMIMTRYRLLGLLPFLWLQACITATTHDQLTRSESKMPLPLGAIHVPAATAGVTSLQGNLAVGATADQGLRPWLTQDLGFSSEEDDSWSSAEAATELRIPSTQFAAEGALILSGRVRLGIGAEGTFEQMASWIDVGMCFGQDWTMESFVVAGMLPQTGYVRWETDHRTKGCDKDLFGKLGCADDSSHVVRESTSEDVLKFMKTGIHFARRSGGPWAEFQVGAISKLTSAPTTGTGYGFKMMSVGIGWTQPTTLGKLTAFARAVDVGGAWVSAGGLQWTGELPLGK